MNAGGFRAVLLALAAFGAGHGQAAESFDGCTGFVTSLPATIATPGTWCLAGDIATNASGFGLLDITADDVTLDCNGFRIDGSSRAPDEYATAIRAVDRRRITVRNCHVRGFDTGLLVTAPQSVRGHHLVEDNRFDHCESSAINVSGDGSVVRRNVVLGTGNVAPQAGATAIAVTGTAVIEDNLVAGVRSHSADASGIRSSLNFGGSIRRNQVSRLFRSGTGDLLFGLYSTSGTHGVAIRDNTIVGDGLPNTIGVLCDTQKGILKDNRILGFATSNFGCRDGGNVLRP